MAKLEGLSSSGSLRQGNFLSTNTGEILVDRFGQIDDITPIDRLFIVDKNGTAKINVAKKVSLRTLGSIFTISNGFLSQEKPYLQSFLIPS